MTVLWVIPLYVFQFELKFIVTWILPGPWLILTPTIKSRVITTFYLYFPFVNFIQYEKYHRHLKSYHGQKFRILYIEVPERFSIHLIVIEKKKVATFNTWFSACQQSLAQTRKPCLIDKPMRSMGKNPALSWHRNFCMGSYSSMDFSFFCGCNHTKMHVYIYKFIHIAFFLLHTLFRELDNAFAQAIAMLNPKLYWSRNTSMLKRLSLPTNLSAAPKGKNCSPSKKIDCSSIKIVYLAWLSLAACLCW